MKKIQLFIIGAPKCGTTSLHRHLEKHPDIFVSNPKELNYFSSTDILKQDLYYDSKVITTLEEYKKIFQKSGDTQVLLDASVSYLYYPSVAKKIHIHNNKAVCVAVLRNPVDRAHSHYLMDKRLGYTTKSFQEIFENKDKYPLHYQQYFELGLYADQIKRYKEIFNENFYVTTNENLRHSPLNVLNKICNLIEISPFEVIELRENNSYKEPHGKIISYFYTKPELRTLARRLIPFALTKMLKGIIFRTPAKPTISPNLEERLYHFYKEDMRELKVITGIDFTK